MSDREPIVSCPVVLWRANCMDVSCNDEGRCKKMPDYPVGHGCEVSLPKPTKRTIAVPMGRR